MTIAGVSNLSSAHAYAAEIAGSAAQGVYTAQQPTGPRVADAVLQARAQAEVAAGCTSAEIEAAERACADLTEMLEDQFACLSDALPDSADPNHWTSRRLAEFFAPRMLAGGQQVADSGTFELVGTLDLRNVDERLDVPMLQNLPPSRWEVLSRSGVNCIRIDPRMTVALSAAGVATTNGAGV